jgi:acyl-CoA dehydrogenase
VKNSELVTRTAAIATEVAAKHAADVDHQSRFPHETFAALKQARLLSAAVPKAFGGHGAGMLELGHQCAALSGSCGSSGMVLAMHHIQVACIARHGADSAYFGKYMREALAERQDVIASITSENGTFGDTRSSICAVEVTGDTMKLE